MQVGRLTEQGPEIAIRFVAGGALVQEADTLPAFHTQWKTVTDIAFPEELLDDIRFGWEMVRHVKSNAIVLARDTSLVGVGAGQMSRVDSVEISIRKAGERAVGSILLPMRFSRSLIRSKRPRRQASQRSFNPADRDVTTKSSQLAITTVFQ